MPTNSQSTSTVISGTAEPEWAARIAIYPNPTTGQFYIKTQDGDIQQVTVMDILGKRVETFRNPREDTPLSILPSSTFFLKIETEKGVINRKIVRL